ALFRRKVLCLCYGSYLRIYSMYPLRTKVSLEVPLGIRIAHACPLTLPPASSAINHRPEPLIVITMFHHWDSLTTAPKAEGLSILVGITGPKNSRSTPGGAVAHPYLATGGDQEKVPGTQWPGR